MQNGDGENESVIVGPTVVDLGHDQPQPLTPTPASKSAGGLTTDDNVPPAPTTPGAGGDESWEIKYGKLREVALKLKKSVLDKTQEIERLKTENSKISGKSQNVSTIQLQFDKALDEVEKYKALEASLQKDLEASIKDNLRLKESSFELQGQVKELTESSKLLKEKLGSNQTTEEEVKQLKLRVEELETELKLIKETQVDVKQEKRQRTMLSLEITDYEKKLADSNEKLLEVQRLLQFHQQLLEDKDKMMTSCESKLVEAESVIGDLGCKVEQLQGGLTAKTDKLSFLQTELSKLNEKFAEKKSELGKLSREYETAKLNFSAESSALVERSEKLTQGISQLEYKISVLEEHKRSRESHISNLKLELVQLESEFGNYKLKAQSMLNTQKPTGSQSAENSDELENLQRIVQDFHSEIAVIPQKSPWSDAKTLKLENETLCLERAELGLKMTQLKTRTIEKEMLHDSEIQKLKESVKQKETEFQNFVEHSKTENATIIASHKAQFDVIKSGYETKLKTLEQEIINLKFIEDSFEDQESSQASQEREVKLPLGTPSVPPTIPLLIDTSSGGFGLEQLRMMPRGECEGSENNMTPNALRRTPSTSCDMTFEQLLSTDMDNLTREKYTDRYPSNSSSIPSQRYSPGEELTRSRNQIKHLQNILRESESNCERLTQLCEALKQEIRRVERDSERQEHLKENTEYLKNIILKFITLQGEDEKSRLIPVIRTMLRLSPSETEQLETAVKGGYAHAQPNRDELTPNSGWSAYVPLPKWSFGGGGK